MYLFHIPKHHREDSMLGYFGSNAPHYHLTYRAYAPFLGLTKHPPPQVNEKPGSCSGIRFVNLLYNGLLSVVVPKENVNRKSKEHLLWVLYPFYR